VTPPAADEQRPRLNATAAALLGLLLDRPMTGSTQAAKRRLVHPAVVVAAAS
jgi:hypothetical protein